MFKLESTTEFHAIQSTLGATLTRKAANYGQDISFLIEFITNLEKNIEELKKTKNSSPNDVIVAEIIEVLNKNGLISGLIA